MKKIILTILFIFTIFCSFGTTYYVSPTGTDLATGKSRSAAWQTISKVNSYSTSPGFQPGDIIQFKRGGTWLETLTIVNSGTALNPINITSWGEGTNPIISGFATISGWTSEGGGIYSKTLTVESNPEIVTIKKNSVGITTQYAMGRTPNANEHYPAASDYYHIDSYTTTSITDTECNSATTDWDNADLIVRGSGLMTYHKFVITSHSGTTLNFSNPTSYALGTGYGYWIQNDLRTLDKFGEWYYGGGKFYMYFGGETPTNYTVNVSVRNNCIYVNTYDDITIKNITFTGANSSAIATKSSTSEAYRIAVKNCMFDFNLTGVYGHLSPEFSVTDCNFKRTSRTSMYLHWYPDGSYIARNVIDSTGLTLGVGLSTTDNSNFYIGMGMYTNYAKHTYSSKDLIVEYNTVLNSGYSGIVFAGDNAIIRKNFVNKAVRNKADGGAYYYGGQNVFKNMTFENNIALNSFVNTDKNGLPAGTTTNSTHGIYFDYNSDGGHTIQNNTVANCDGAGIYIHMSDSLLVTGNNLYNNYYAIRMQELEGYSHPLRHDTIQNNYIVNDTTNNYLVWARSLNNDFASTGIINNNYYSADISHTTPFMTAVASWSFTYRSFSGWKSTSSQDASSYYTKNTGKNTIFDYNTGKSSKTVSITGSYLKADSTEVTTSYTLQPFQSITLIKDTIETVDIDSMYAAYPLNGNLNDSIGTQHGTNSGAVVTTSGKFKAAYDFDNTSDYTYFPINTTNLNNLNYSISFWVKLDILPSTAGVGYYLVSDIKSGASFKMILSVNTSNTLGVNIRNAALTGFTSNSVAGAIGSTGVWYHIVVNVAKVGYTSQLFINGERSIGSTNQQITGTDRTSDYRFYLGSYTGTTGLDGQIDDVVIRNCWTTAAEASYIYKEGAGRYYPYTGQ